MNYLSQTKLSHGDDYGVLRKFFPCLEVSLHLDKNYEQSMNHLSQTELSHGDDYGVLRRFFPCLEVVLHLDKNYEWTSSPRKSQT